MAAAMAAAISSISDTAWDISLTELTACSVAALTASICWVIRSVDSAVWFARFFTSEATTANPFAGLSRAGRFDGRVQGKQVGLGGNVSDQFYDLADLGDFGPTNGKWCSTSGRRHSPLRG